MTLPAPTPAHAPPGREPQLDGLRCLAFLAVFALHAAPERFPWGWGGVQVFFALSGFLITRLLVRGHSGHLGADLGRYYYRRTLRIFPLYYAVLALVALTGRLPDAGWFATYTYNIRGYLNQGVDETIGHFWTLCVEEQFYLLYPLLLLLTPARFRFGLIVALLVAAKGFQAWAEGHANVRAARILLPFCGEDLLWGCLAGLIDLRRPPGRREGTACLALGLPLLVLGWNLHVGRLPLAVAVQDLASTTLYGVGSALLVFGASRCRDRWLVGLLALTPVAYLGRISYGLYAFHMPVLRGWTRATFVDLLLPSPWADLALTIALASLSWHWFEGPINRLKDRRSRITAEVRA